MVHHHGAVFACAVRAHACKECTEFTQFDRRCMQSLTRGIREAAAFLVLQRLRVPIFIVVRAHVCSKCTESTKGAIRFWWKQHSWYRKG